jgi:alcohol dehydrogenase class IV
MSYASLLGGLALANAGLGVVHGFAAPIGGMFDAPHGAVCAAILPHGIEANIRALRKRDPGGGGLARYREIARVLTGDPEAIPEDGLNWVRNLTGKLNIPRLSIYGIGSQHVEDIVAKAARASSIKANPVELTANELRWVMENAI